MYDSIIQLYQVTGDVIFLQEMLIQISAICTLGLIRIGPMKDLFAETAALKGIIAQMKAEGVPTVAIQLRRSELGIV